MTTRTATRGAVRDEGAARRRPVSGALEAVGEGATLLVRSLRALPRRRGLPSELARQTALTLTGSALLLAAISLLAGTGCGTESIAITRGLGARGAAGGVGVFCTLREVVPIAFGYVFVVAVGCRLVGDLADSEEDPAQTVGPRVLAALLTLPFAYAMALGGASVALLATGVARFGDIPFGPFIGLYLAFQDDTDIALSFLKGLVVVIFALGAALRLGARARREGDAGFYVARYAVVGLSGVTVLAAALTVILWAANPRIPAG